MASNRIPSFTHLGAIGSVPRTELRAALGLTGCEVSVNALPAGVSVPFVHAHRENEEVYLVLSGTGTFSLDGVLHPLREGDAVRVAPAVERCLKAGDEAPLVYLCVQAREDGTPSVTRDDGVIVKKDVRWS
jgi:uncharacterized cupin superfamily protein